MSDTIHPLRLTQPRTRAGKSVTLAEMALRIALEGCKMSVLDPREARREVIELPAASRPEYKSPCCVLCGRESTQTVNIYKGGKRQGIGFFCDDCAEMYERGEVEYTVPLNQRWQGEQPEDGGSGDA